MKIATMMFVLLGSTLVAHAGVEEKKQRDAVDEAATKTAADIKDCGKAFKVTFDWKAFDGLDWAALKREKNQYYGLERSNLAHLGEGLNKLCADKDYKAALVKIDTIIYRSTNDDKIRVKAVINGSTMILDNYSFGSTRDASDYQAAAKATL
jgi:hypothetical protein